MACNTPQVDPAWVLTDGRFTRRDDRTQSEDRQVAGQEITVCAEGPVPLKSVMEGQAICQADGKKEERSNQVNDGQADIGGMFQPRRNDLHANHVVRRYHRQDGKAAEQVD